LDQLFRVLSYKRAFEYYCRIAETLNLSLDFGRLLEGIEEPNRFRFNIEYAYPQVDESSESERPMRGLPLFQDERDDVLDLETQY